MPAMEVSSKIPLLFNGHVLRNVMQFLLTDDRNLFNLRGLREFKIICTLRCICSSSELQVYIQDIITQTYTVYRSISHHRLSSNSNITRFVLRKAGRYFQKQAIQALERSNRSVKCYWTLSDVSGRLSKSDDERYLKGETKNRSKVLRRTRTVQSMRHRYLYI